MADPGLGDIYDAFTILDVLENDLCARAILDYVTVKDIVRSETTSLRWRRAVLAYLRHSKLTFFSVQANGGWWSGPDVLPRRIVISPKQYSIELLSKTLDKFGSSILELNSSRCDEKYFDIIVSKCPNLQHIDFHDLYWFNPDARLPLHQMKNYMQLKSLVVSGSFTDHVLGEIFQQLHCEKIGICWDNNLTGSFLNYINSINNLKTLTITSCFSLDILYLHTSVYNLRNITSLEMNNNRTTVLDNLHLLLNEMPKLEELTLCEYAYTNVSQELIESFGRLGNLKRLTMIYNDSVNDDLLEALAQGNPNLEYLNLCKSTYYTRGLAALCCRAPPAVTTLCLGYIENCTYDLAARIRTNLVVEELEKLGCVELSPQLLEAFCRASQGRRYPVYLRARCPTSPTTTFGPPGKELRVILFDADIKSFMYEGPAHYINSVEL